MLTLKYESPYLLPWLAWHKLAGIERIFLYLDDPLGTDAHVHAPILDAVGRVPWVSVTTMCAARTPNLKEVLLDCARRARGDGFVWMANWDLDESPAFAAAARRRAAAARRVGAPAELPGAAGGGGGARADERAGDHARELWRQRPRAAAGGAVGVQAHTERLNDVNGPGKLVWRLDEHGTGGANATHIHNYFMYSTHHIFARYGDTVRNMDGSNASAREDQRKWEATRWETTSARPGVIITAMDACEPDTTCADGGSAVERVDERLLPVRLHHYLSRSQAECEKKGRPMKRALNSGAQRLDFTWRAISRMNTCWLSRSGRPGRFTRDASLAQYAPAVRREVEAVFGEGALAAAFAETDALRAEFNARFEPDRPRPNGLTRFAQTLGCYARKSKTTRAAACEGEGVDRNAAACDWGGWRRFTSSRSRTSTAAAAASRTGASWPRRASTRTAATTTGRRRRAAGRRSRRRSSRSRGTRSRSTATSRWTRATSSKRPCGCSVYKCDWAIIAKLYGRALCASICKMRRRASARSRRRSAATRSTPKPSRSSGSRASTPRKCATGRWGATRPTSRGGYWPRPFAAWRRAGRSCCRIEK